MELFRLANAKYIEDLSGTGARLYGGRWNSVGTPAVYLASSKSLAVLEVLVHLNPALFPDDFCMASFAVPDDSFTALSIEKLPTDWKNNQEQLLKRFGDEFIRKNEYLGLKVPSAIVDDEFNYILNPNHPLMNKVKIKLVKPFIFDNRLV
ncbi:RES family NAD+ phosphorylase [Pedobacter glucosidilyticus]|uniref:RES family NAD+ phosphorylase n=1 Tax=Pedobacter glucosidilyticus TaxID=1122941 RepID=UPI000422A641|nr:RES family NAD+ phosphorylase [Pedobacter glucosidilyticus]